MTEKLTGTEQSQSNYSLESAVLTYFPELKFPDNQEDKKTLLDFFSLAFDRGLVREIKFRNQSEPSVYMLNRRAFISKLCELAKIDLDNLNSKNFVLLRIDVANVFSANQVVDERGRQGGDLVIQRAARTIQEAAVAFSQTREDRQILIGRYGGDEFTIALIGDYTENDIKKLKETISQQISSKQAYFQTEQNNAELKPLEVKIEDIESSEDENLRRLFYANLKRGVILSPEELKRDIEAFKENGKIDQTALEEYLEELQIGNYYPQETITAEDKLEFLKAQHPEFIPAFDAAQRNGFKLEFLANFVENYLADPLLNRIVITRFDVREHLLKNGFTQIIAFEIKLKEVNKIYSYSVADNLIISLWEQIKDILGEEANKVKIGRFGGLIFIGIPKRFNPKIVTNLSTIQKVKARFGKKTIEMFVGFTKIDIPSDINLENLHKTMAKIFAFPTKKWIERNLNYIFEDENRAEEFRKLLEGEISASNDPIINLLAAYFGNSPRAWTRIKKATYLPDIDPSIFLGYELPF